MTLPFYARLALVCLIAVALSEAIPEAVNAVLILILAGIILGHWEKFSFLAQALGTLKG